MPIEIRELVIRARVDPGDERAPAAPQPLARETPRPEELIQSCVLEALRAIEDRKER